MLILFPHDSSDDRAPDPAFTREYEAAKAAGLMTGFVDTIVPKYPALKLRETYPGELLIYRGWMLSVSDYATLYEMAWKLGYRMINTPNEYAYCHELPKWYPDFESITPKSIWLTQSFEDQLDGKTFDLAAIATEVREKLGEGPYIIKDFVKSRKHEWAEACFIEGPNDIERVAKCFVERQAEDLAGGLVFRKFEKFKPVGKHPKSGTPIVNEVRGFVVRGHADTWFPYWGPEEGGETITLPSNDEWHSSWGTDAKSNFYTMDLAQFADDNRWQVIELGDGQVAGLPEHVDAEQFYRKLKERFV